MKAKILFISLSLFTACNSTNTDSNHYDDLSLCGDFPVSDGEEYFICMDYYKGTCYLQQIDRDCEEDCGNPYSFYDLDGQTLSNPQFLGYDPDVCSPTTQDYFETHVNP